MMILFLGNKSPQQPQSFYPFSDGNIYKPFHNVKPWWKWYPNLFQANYRSHDKNLNSF